MSWTINRVDDLKKLWNQGYTASQIAKSLGEITRNAVIGKAHRLGLSGRAPSPKSRKTSNSNFNQNQSIVKNKRILRNKLVLDTNFLKNLPPEEPKNIETVKDSDCKWPVGDPRKKSNFYFCGRKSIDGESYCILHMTEAYQPMTKERRRSSTRARNYKVAVA